MKASDNSKAYMKKLERQNRELKSKNRQLENKLARTKSTSTNSSRLSRTWRKVAIFLLIALSGALLIVCNVTFWAGRSVVDSETFKTTSSQLIKDPEIQHAITIYATDQIFANTDPEAFIASVLPERASFLAPTLSDRLEGYTQTTIAKILASPKFQDAWVNISTGSHDNLLKIANSPQGRDGVINLNEVYQTLSADLKDTKLAFLADKQLPDNVGKITVLKSDNLRYLHIVSSNINTFKYVSLGLIIGFSAVAVWLSRTRRRTVVRIGALFSLLMIATLLSLRIMTAITAAHAQPVYQEAVRHTVGIVTRPLVLQSYSLLLLSFIAASIAYLGGSSKTATKLRTRSQMMLSGKTHKALFEKENSLTIWLGNHKQALRIALLLGLVILGLFIRLTPKTILALGIIGLIGLLVIELLAAEPKKK